MLGRAGCGLNEHRCLHGIVLRLGPAQLMLPQPSRWGLCFVQGNEDLSNVLFAGALHFVPASWPAHPTKHSGCSLMPAEDRLSLLKYAIFSAMSTMVYTVIAK